MSNPYHSKQPFRIGPFYPRYQSQQSQNYERNLDLDLPTHRYAKPPHQQLAKKTRAPPRPLKAVREGSREPWGTDFRLLE